MNSTYVHALFRLFSLALFFFQFIFLFVLCLCFVSSRLVQQQLSRNRGTFVLPCYYVHIDIPNAPCVSCQNNASVSRQCHHEIPWSYTNKEKQRPYKLIGEPIYGNTELLDPTTQS